MRKNRWLWIFISLFTVFILLIGIEYWQKFSPAAEFLTEEEAQTLVENSYKGEVTKINLHDDQYIIKMQRNHIVYQIVLGVSNKEVLSFTKIESIDHSPQEKLPKETEEREKEEPSKILSEAEAGKIALGEVEGIIDDIDLESNDRYPFYLIDIETKDDREAVVQIDAATGKVLSVTWDD